MFQCDRYAWASLLTDQTIGVECEISASLGKKPHISTPSGCAKVMGLKRAEKGWRHGCVRRQLKTPLVTKWTVQGSENRKQVTGPESKIEGTTRKDSNVTDVSMRNSLPEARPRRS